MRDKNEVRIARVERTLVAIYDALPSFIKGNLMHLPADTDGETIDENIEAMRKENSNDGPANG